MLLGAIWPPFSCEAGLGKNIVAAIFIIISFVALVVFFSRDDRTLKDQVNLEDRKPRVILEGFTLYKYSGHEIQSTLTGKIAHFIDPNVLEVYGDIRGLRHNTEKREHFAAQSATAYFSSSGIVQLMQKSEIVRCEVENNVRVGFGDNLILTQYAQYLGKDKTLRSDLPVEFRAPQSRLHGKSGFDYRLEDEELDIHGPIKGTLQGEPIKSL